MACQNTIQHIAPQKNAMRQRAKRRINPEKIAAKDPERKKAIKLSNRKEHKFL
jgi:hypothetical protein